VSVCGVSAMCGARLMEVEVWRYGCDIPCSGYARSSRLTLLIEVARRHILLCQKLLASLFLNLLAHPYAH
jgi:hypothetical protein